MSRELDCKWYFAEQSGIEHGPNDPIEEIYRGEKFASLVRESIQNSLDAVFDPHQPVIVKFAFKQVMRGDFPNFFELKKYIKGCLEHYPNNENAKANYEPMLDFFSSRKMTSTIDYIRVSDYNTKGMDYYKGTNSPFYAFVQSEGVSSKDDRAAGGSFGFGKGAYFALSDIRTVIVSTKTVDDKYFFSGIAKLCTSEIGNTKYSFSGFYGDNNEEPIDAEERIPAPFRRKEPGTDINVMAFDIGRKEDAKKEMIAAVVRNFWYAIYRGELIAEIDDITIDNESLESIITEYLPKENDTTGKAKSYSPLPYYNAVIHANESDKYQLFEEKIPHLGRVKLYTNVEKDAVDKVLYLRKLKMVVYAKRTGTNNGVYGVFVCEDEEGNEILRCAENSAHNEWKKKNNRSRKISSAKIQESLEGIQAFIDRSFNRLFTSNGQTTLNITGLEDYLYVPEDLLEEQTTNNNSDDNDTNPFMGTPTGKTLPDSPSITSVHKVPLTAIPRVTTDNGIVKTQQDGRIEPNDNADETQETGHTTDKTIDKNGNVAPGNQSQKADINEAESGTHKTILNVKYRVFAQEKLFKVYHYVIIHAPYNVSSCELQIRITGEDSDTNAIITESDTGDFQDNIINNFSLKEGKNIIRVRFNDNMKYAVNLTAYEIQ